MFLTVEIRLFSNLISTFATGLAGAEPLGPISTAICGPKLVTPGILVTDTPKDVFVNTGTPSIAKYFPVASSMCSVEYHFVPFLSHVNSWSLAPLSIKPPPSAYSSVFDALSPRLAKTMFLSSIVNTLVLTVVTSPCTVKFPTTVKLPPTVVTLSVNPSYIFTSLVGETILTAVSLATPFCTAKLKFLFDAVLYNLTLPAETLNAPSVPAPTFKPLLLVIINGSAKLFA